MKKGKPFEERVEKLITSKGGEILAKNYRSKFGEIDIIALYKGRLLIIEVKGGKNPLWRIDCNKVRRIYLTYLNFLKENSRFADFETLFVGAFVEDNRVSFKRIFVDDCLEGI